MFCVPAGSQFAPASAASSSSATGGREEAGRRELVRVTGHDGPVSAHRAAALAETANELIPVVRIDIKIVAIEHSGDVAPELVIEVVNAANRRSQRRGVTNETAGFADSRRMLPASATCRAVQAVRGRAARLLILG
jgi:hypothetical protein